MRDERGFTLVEVLAASVMLLVGLFAAIQLMDVAAQETGRNRDRQASNNVAREISEVGKNIPYAAVTANGIGSSLQAQPGMADADPVALGWQVDRNGVRYTVAATACSVDDSKDDYGLHPGGITWCSGTTGTADSNAEDYKRVTVTVTPPTGKGSKTSVSAIIADNRSAATGSGSGGGTGTGVGAGSAILQDPLCTGCSAGAWQATTSIAPCLNFTATTGADKCNPTYDGSPQANYVGNQIGAVPIKAIFPTAMASANFYIVKVGEVVAYQRSLLGIGWDGASGWNPVNLPRTLLGSGTQDPSDARVWNLTWDLADAYPNQTPDGPYVIYVQGYDDQGQASGLQLSLSLWLNRFIPDIKWFAPPLAGKNPQWTRTEVELYPAADSASRRRDFDYTGYAPYRTSTSTLACSAGGTTTAGQLNPYMTLIYGGSPGTLMTDPPNWSYRQATTAASSGAGWTNCHDAYVAGASLTYTLRIRSAAPDGTLAETEGGNLQSASANVNATPVNNRPTAPTHFNVQWVKVGGVRGFLKFTWTHAGGTTGDTDGCIMSYRIYQTASGTTTPLVTNRTLRTPWGVAGGVAPCAGTTQRNPDASIGYTSHNIGTSVSAPKFFITAVDDKLAESTIATGTNQQMKVLSPTTAPP